MGLRGMEREGVGCRPNFGVMGLMGDLEGCMDS
jgi:hypothetical protein